MASIAEILSLPSLALDAIAIPRPEARARWVTMSELADPSPFLEGGEILLTTGLIERDAGQWRHFVGLLLEAGVIALGFGVGLSYPNVPRGLREAAIELSLNLFSVPRPVPFIAVSRAVADLLWAAEREAVKQSLQHQQELTNAAIGGPADLMGTLSRILDGHAVLCAPDGSVIAGFPAVGQVERALPHIERMSMVCIRGASTDIVRGSRLSVQSIGSGSQAEAYLVVESESTGTAQRVAITTAVALLTLDREQARVELEVHRRIRAGALSLALRSDLEAASLLLSGTSQDAMIPLSRARVVRARGSVGELERTLARIERSSTELGHPLVAVAAEQLVAIITQSGDQLDALIRMIEPLEVGVGPTRPLTAIGHSDDGARQSLAATSAARPVVVWSELARTGVDGLLDATALQSFAENLLDAVLTREDAGELLEALRAFLTHNGHVGPAAEALGVHRNTLRNRLMTAESQLGRSIHDPQFRADLWVALKQLRDARPHRVRQGLAQRTTGSP